MTACAACGERFPAGAGACPECGYRPGAAPAIDAEANLCPNAACGTLNPDDVRVCQRCATPLGSPPGSVLGGRYRLVERIAAGGFGIVYRAADLAHGNRPVAVKEMIPGAPAEQEPRRVFFRREAEILRSLQRLTIVPRLFDFLETPEAAHLVIEYIPGKDLYQEMEANGGRPFPLADVADWGAQICEVLAAMHSREPALVHRDLKPDNVMVLPDGSIRLIDYGTARALGEIPEASRARQRTRIFTEGYAPPEQVIGRPEPRSDLFSLAGTLYHLATGMAPEGFFTAREIWGRLDGDGDPIAEGDRWFFELLATNLAEDVRNRHPNAGEFRRELTRMAVRCRGCSAENAAAEPFCVKCARPLRGEGRTCRRCETVNRLGCHHCVNCGERLLATRGG